MKAQVNRHATQKNKSDWPLSLPGNLLAWMDDSIKLQDAKGRKKIGKDGENWEQEQCEKKKRCNTKII